MDSQEYANFMESIRKTQQQSKRIMQSIDGTLGNVRSTLQDIQQTKNNIKKIEDTYNNVMDTLAQKIAMSFSPKHPFLKEQGVNYQNLPKKIQMSEAVENMLSTKSKEILFVTGAGVSVDSGIPTFRGKDGLYSKNFEFQGKQYSPQVFITKGFYTKNPQPIWKWIDQLYKITKSTKSNQVHVLIHQCMLQLVKKGMKPILVTQNIDDLHIDPPNRQYQYHRIHGSINKIRCINMHMKNYEAKLIGSRCEICSQPLRPHVMFFDESYGVQFGGEVKDRQFDFVVVIGTSLNTGLCIKLVSNGKQIIQINPSPVIQVGKVYPFQAQTVSSLKQMLSQLKKH